MEFSVFRQVLIRALGHMQSIVEKRAALPILVNVKIEVADDLILSATNVDLELVEHVAADITLSGKTTVPVQMLYDIVRKLPDDAEISFKQSGDQLVVSSGRAVFHLPLADGAPNSVRPVSTRSGRFFQYSLSMRKYSCSAPSVHAAWPSARPKSFMRRFSDLSSACIERRSGVFLSSDSPV